jgi:hypothetical protein
MRAAKARKREALGSREVPLSPPDLRRIVVVIDFDSGRPMMRMMQLWRSDRLDRYRVRTPRGESRRPVSWSNIAATLRKRFPRVRSGCA